MSSECDPSVRVTRALAFQGDVTWSSAVATSRDAELPALSPDIHSRSSLVLVPATSATPGTGFSTGPGSPRQGERNRVLRSDGAHWCAFPRRIWQDRVSRRGAGGEISEAQISPSRARCRPRVLSMRLSRYILSRADVAEPRAPLPAAPHRDKPGPFPGPLRVPRPLCAACCACWMISSCGYTNAVTKRLLG